MKKRSKKITKELRLIYYGISMFFLSISLFLGTTSQTSPMFFAGVGLGFLLAALIAYFVDE